ncbi:MAG TPA: hypothetical protein VJ898_01320 [Natrialbaceae archaeon]|nr:hypothetical protein [Natrialbaceae archaeon]
MRSKSILAVLAAAMLLVWGVSPAMAATEPTSTNVDANTGTGAPIPMATNNTTDGNLTDGNTTDGNVTDGNETDGNGTLTFGQELNRFKQQLRNGSNVSFSGNFSISGMDVENASFGMIVAEWVVRNNPGNAPPWAGPVDETGAKENRTGPPSWAGNDSDSGNESGPPGWAGNDSDSGNESGPGNGHGGDNGNGQGNGNGNGNGHGNGNGGGPPGQSDRITIAPIEIDAAA